MQYCTRNPAIKKPGLSDVSSIIDINDNISVDFKITTTAGTKRIAKAAFEFAKANGNQNVSIVTKANIMKKTWTCASF